MPAAPGDLHVEVLHQHLRDQIAALEKPVVGDVMRLFLDVSALAVARGLWSLEFSFDEDDSRIARAEALFGDGLRAARTNARLRGYAVRFLLPKTLPKYSVDGGGKTSEHMLEMPSDTENLIARFVRSLAALGAYRFIEALELESVETESI